MSREYTLGERQCMRLLHAELDWQTGNELNNLLDNINTMHDVMELELSVTDLHDVQKSLRAIRKELNQLGRTILQNQQA